MDPKQGWAANPHRQTLKYIEFQGLTYPNISGRSHVSVQVIKSDVLTNRATVNKACFNYAVYLLLYSHIIYCFCSVIFAVVSLFAQHNHRNGLLTLIQSLSAVN